MIYISFHAAIAFISSFLSLVCGIRTWQHFKETGNYLIKYLTFVFFSVTIAMLMLVPPALFFQSQLLSPFLALAIFFLFLGTSFFFRIVVSFFSKLSNYRKTIFLITVSIGIFLAILTFFSNPSLIFERYGLMTTYNFSPILKLFLVIFTILSTSFLSGSIFLIRAFSSSVFLIRIRSILFGIALIFIGIGILLVVIGESFFYNLFIILAFILFYLSTSFREEIKDRFYGKT